MTRANHHQPNSSRARYRGSSASSVDGRRLTERTTPEGQHGRHAGPGPASIADCITAGVCPWCGSGPYQVLAGHTYRKHGIDKIELRRLGGFKYHDSICDPALSDRYRQLRLEDGRTPPSARAEPRSCIICHHEIPFGPKHTRNATCGRGCERIRRSQLMSQMRAEQPRLERWSLKRDRCIDCETSDRPHRSGGRCSQCYDATRSKTRPDRNHPTAEEKQAHHRRLGAIAGSRKAQKAATATVYHGVARTYDHGCRCTTCREYRRWVRGRSPVKPDPVAGSMPCHPGCTACARYEEMIRASQVRL